MAKASTTTTLNDTDGTALVAGDRVQATNTGTLGTVVSFTATRVRIKFDGTEYASSRNYNQVPPAKLRKLDTEKDNNEQRADRAAQRIADRATETTTSTITQQEREEIANEITNIAAAVMPHYYQPSTPGTPLETLHTNTYGVNRYATKPLCDANVATVEQLSELVSQHLAQPKGSELSSIDGLGERRVSSLVAAVLLWRDLTGQPTGGTAEMTEVEPGTAVTIRPVKNGEVSKRRSRALALSTTGTMVRVWVPGLGTPRIQGSVQEIHIREVLDVEQLADCPGSWVVHNMRRARKDGSHVDLPTAVWETFEAAAKAHHEAYKAKHATK